MATSGSVRLVYRVVPTSLSGKVTVKYQVLPVGMSDFPSVGTVTQHSSLASIGRIAASNVAVKIRYEVFERPKVTAAFISAADAFVLDAEPTINYGDTVDLIVGRFDSKLARSLIRFDISSLRTDLVILSAVLRLSARIIGKGQVEAHDLLGSWDEPGVTWYNQPGRHIAAEDTSPMADIVELDITTLFLGWYKNTRANNGIVITSSNEQSQTHIVFASREWPQAIRRPQLLVTYYMPDALVASSELPSTGRVIGHTQSDLSSTGAVAGVWDDLTSIGRVSRPSVVSIGHVSQRSDIQSTGSVRGTRVADDFTSLGYISRPNLPSSGSPRVSGQNDFTGTGYVLERNNLPSTGYPRVPAADDLPGSGYVSGARNELPSKGVVDGYYNDLSSSGYVRITVFSELPSSGYVSKAPNELPSRGHVTGPWMRSRGTVNQVSNLYSRGRVRVVFDLPTTGFVTFSGKSDLPSSGYTRIRDVSEILSIGNVKANNSDLPSKGHVGPWILEASTTAKIWPPEGRSVI